MNKIFESIINFNININLGGDKKIEVGSGKSSSAVLVASSYLKEKILDQSNNFQKIKLNSRKFKKLKNNKSITSPNGNS